MVEINPSATEPEPEEPVVEDKPPITKEGTHIANNLFKLLKEFEEEPEDEQRENLKEILNPVSPSRSDEPNSLLGKKRSWGTTTCEALQRRK